MHTYIFAIIHIIQMYLSIYTCIYIYIHAQVHNDGGWGSELQGLRLAELD